MNLQSDEERFPYLLPVERKNMLLVLIVEIDYY